MGDMTGWRFLEKGEMTLISDERFWQVYPQMKEMWQQTHGGIVVNHGIYRRRISVDSPKPAIAAESISQSQASNGQDGKCSVKGADKRFVTVVYEVKIEDGAALDEALLKPHQMLDIREGNYLELFDGIKDRVLGALEGEK
jgi:hypothetical protein